MRPRFATPGLLGVLLCGIIGPIARADDAEAIARQILDDSRPQEVREALVRDHPELSDKLIVAMTADLKPGMAEEEYRRIPWIWRVAVAAGKRNDADELRRVLDVSLPADQEAAEKLEHWRAVVVGGGVINGIGLAGEWPEERIEAIVTRKEGMFSRWYAILIRSRYMMDEENVPTGTRYDAMRIAAMLPWDISGGPLFRYLLKGVHPELQQGAISGLSDVRSPCVPQALLSGLPHYSPENRAFALDALLRDEQRQAALLDAVEDGRVRAGDLGPERVKKLRASSQAEIRERAKTLLSK